MTCDVVAVHRRGLYMVAALALLAISSTQALADSRNRSPDPADPKATVPATTYEPSLGDFQRFEPSKTLPWKRANETVGTVGGHMGSMGDDPAKTDKPAGADQKPK